MQLEAGKGLGFLIKSFSLLFPLNAKFHLQDGKKKNTSKKKYPFLLHEEGPRLNRGVASLANQVALLLRDLSSRLGWFWEARGSAGLGTSPIDLLL